MRRQSERYLIMITITILIIIIIIIIILIRLRKSTFPVTKSMQNEMLALSQINKRSAS